MGSKRPATSSNYNHNSRHYPHLNPFPASINAGSTSGTSDPINPRFSSFLNRGKPFNSVQAVTAQSRSPLFSSSKLPQPTASAQDLPQVPSPTTSTTPISCQTHPVPGMPHDVRSWSDLVLTIETVLEKNLHVVGAGLESRLIPHFDSMLAEINSMRVSLNDVKHEVSKVKEETQGIAEVQRASHASYMEALEDAKDKITALEARLGQSYLEHEGGDARAVIGRLDEIYLTLGKVAEKAADPEADAPWLSPRSMRREIGVSPLKSALTSQPIAPKSSVPRFFPVTQVRTIPDPSYNDTSIPSRQTQNTEMDDLRSKNGASATDPGPIYPRAQEPSFFTSSPKACTAIEQLRMECSISPIPRKLSDALHGFSKVDWEQEAERRSASVTPAYQPPPISPSCRLSQSPNLEGVRNPRQRDKTRSKEPSPLSQYEAGARSQDQDQDQSQFQCQGHISEPTGDVAPHTSPAMTDRHPIPDLEYPTREATPALDGASPKASQKGKSDGDNEKLDEAEPPRSQIPPDSPPQPAQGDHGAALIVNVLPPSEITTTQAGPPAASLPMDSESSRSSSVPGPFSPAQVIASPATEQENQQGTETETEEGVPTPVFSKNKIPLFLPDSRVTTASPGLGRYSSVFATEKTEEREVSQSLLFRPGQEHTPVPSTAERKTPIVDVSQFSSPCSQDPLHTPKADINTHAEDEPKEPESRGMDPSSTEAARVNVELTTLSELSLSPCSSLSELDDDDEVDELLPDSEPSEAGSTHKSEFRAEREESAEDIQETFTPKLAAIADSSIQSFDTLTAALNALNSPIESPGSKRDSPMVRREGSKEELSSAKSGGVTGTRSTETTSSFPSFSSVLSSAAGAENMINGAPAGPLTPATSPSRPPSPNKDCQVEPDSLTGLSPSPVIETRAKDKPREEQMTPLALPTYLSPVNTPSSSPMPTMRLRKRKLEEIKGGIEVHARAKVSEAQANTQGQTPQVERQSQTVTETSTRNAMRMMKTSDAPQLPSSVRRKVTTTTTLIRSSRHQPSPADVSAGESGGRKRRRRREEDEIEGGSPIYIPSASSTPTGGGKGIEVELIDLTDSPVVAKTAAQDKILPAPGQRKAIRCMKVATGHKGKAQREDKREKERMNKEEQERQSREKKQKQKMLPLGAEDSDDAEVIPAKSFKEPILRLDADEEEEDGRSGGGATSTSRALRGPAGRELQPKTVDFRSLVAKQGANAKGSRAVTKIKKRGRASAPSANASGDGKEWEMNEEDEPPLKRARRLLSVDPESVIPVGPRNREPKKSPRKAKEDKVKNDRRKGVDNVDGDGDVSKEVQRLSAGVAPSNSVVRIKWPAKKHGDRSFQKNFIECDMCCSWYHYGCVGIQPNDIRLQDSEIFACPPCGAGRYEDATDLADDREKSPHDTCSRPDCGFKRISSDQNEFFVKRIMGRRCKIQGGRGRIEEWLVEWDGYPISEATWEKETSMANPEKLIESFVAAAEEEGLDLDQNPNTTILLEGARRNGWRA